MFSYRRGGFRGGGSEDGCGREVQAGSGVGEGGREGVVTGVGVVLEPKVDVLADAEPPVACVREVAPAETHSN